VLSLQLISPFIGSLYAFNHLASRGANNRAMLPLGKNNSSSQKGRHADRVLGTKIIEGTVVRFERGDYLWVVVKDSGGNERSLDFPDQLSTEYFLARHMGKTLVITDQIVSPRQESLSRF